MQERFSVHKRLQRKQRPSAWTLCLFSSLLVGIRANFTHIKVVGDKTGCHRFACNVSWAWFLLWAGSAALHFYSNPPKTIPCVIWLRSLSRCRKQSSRRHRCMQAGSFQRILYSGTPGYYQLYITTAGVGWAHRRGHQRAPLPCWCVIKMGWASLSLLRQAGHGHDSTRSSADFSAK